MTFPSRVALALGLVCAAAGARTLGAQARTPEPTKDSALVAYDDDGLRIHTPDRKRQFKVRGYFVLDGRQVLSDTADASTNGFNMRRARVIFDANLFPGIAMRLMYDVGPISGPSALQDAYLDFGVGGGWWVRAGKQKVATSLERYMSISSQLLPERSLASNLTPSRDPGILLTGPLAGEHLELSLGVFNGAADGGVTQDNDPNDDKDVTYRLWWRPIKQKVKGAEQGVGIGVWGTRGIEKSPAVAGARLPAFRSIAQSQWFSYSEAAGARANGEHLRNGVFGYVHEGPFGAMAEWYGHSQVVTRGATTATVHTGGWTANAQYSLTGELSNGEGIVPDPAFDVEKGHWGAWQVGLRASHVSVGSEAFPTFADSTVSARGATELGAAVNWYLTKQTKLQVAYEHTTFDGGAKNGNRKAERYVQARWQVYF